MSNEPPCIKCPSCGSLLTSYLNYSGMWGCHYHLCRAIFPVFSLREKSDTFDSRRESSLSTRSKNEQINSSLIFPCYSSLFCNGHSTVLCTIRVPSENSHEDGICAGQPSEPVLQIAATLKAWSRRYLPFISG